MIRSIDMLARNNRWSHHHPAEKALLYLGGLILVMLAPHDYLPVASISVGLAVFAATLAGARVPWRPYLACIALPAGFLLTSLAALAVSLDWSAGWRLDLAPDAWQVIWPPLARSLATLACLVGLAVTTPVSDLLAVAARSGVPSFICDLALMIYRQIWVTAEILERSIAAQRARLGFGGYRGTLRSLGIVAATLFPRLLDRSQQIELGLAARNFDGRLLFQPAWRPIVPRRIATIGVVLAGLMIATCLFPVPA
ncbi:MAG: cobalt ECF transporter T component CbiQ [Rhodospirillaceae bacterium]|nr:cobalt ECF transporter T component CbiQ [Rhodospirillaceae bacterium]